MLSALDDLFDQGKAFEHPPVDRWCPQKTVEFDLRIAANGEWIHEGGRIPRPSLIKLFSTVLVVRDGEYFLMTPQVKYKIVVEEAPFLAVECKMLGEGDDQQLVFRTNIDEVVVADRDHPLEVVSDPQTAEPKPYLMVRDGLRAKLTRAVFYQLANFAVVAADHGDRLGVLSAGQFFCLE